MKSETAFEKIKWCIHDIEEFKDLIQINEADIALAKRYTLLESISGKQIKNRIENLILACWSAKDYLKKEITSEIDQNAAKVFETNLFKHDETELIQYLADSIKHGDIDQKYLKNNKFKLLEPKLEKTVLSLSNQSAPGALKPFYSSEGDDVPGFDIQKVIFQINSEIHYNFDTIHLTIKIVDINKRLLGDAITLVFKFTQYLKKEYNRFIRV